MVFSVVDYDLLSQIAVALGGEEAIKVVKELRELGKATDDQLAQRTSIPLNDVRKILYALQSASLVTVDRTRDKKTGWFIFHWKLQPDAAEGFAISRKKKVLAKLEARLEYERSHDFYACPLCRRRIPFEQAIELVFKCPTCSEALAHEDNEQIVEALTKRIEKLKLELARC